MLFLFAVMLISVFVLIGCSNQPSYSNIKAQNGTMDLTQIQFEKDVVKLDGEWAFYWNQLLQPGELELGSITGYIHVPGSWNKYEPSQKQDSGDGYATYRLTFITSKNERLALKIPRLHTAYRLWVNQKLTAFVGTVGQEIDTVQPQYLPQVAFFEAKQGSNEIVIQISNFHHRSGGILETIAMGSEAQILDLRYKRVASDLLLFGALAFIGAYHLALFVFRRKDPSPLYFGLFCILFGLRTLLVGDMFFSYLFPHFSWEIAHKIQTLTYYLGVPLILMFFVSLFGQYFHAPIIKLTQLVAAAFGLLVLFTPVRIFSVANPVHQVWSTALSTYILVMLLKVSIRRVKGGWLIAAGALVLALTGLNDIIYYSIWRNDYGPSFLSVLFRTGNLSSVGQIVFAFANSLLLAKRFSNALEREEVMTTQLTAINSNLDELVSQRTEALAKSNEEIEHQKLALEKANQQLRDISLKDPLTGIWNRRKYDEAINAEWYRCLRHQRPIALILLDIDHFKQFNDVYGHIEGDACLIKIAKTLKNSLSRSTDLVVRYGGEEFVVLLPEMDMEEAIHVANILLQKVEALHIPHIGSPVSEYVTISAGVAATVPQKHSSHEDLIRTADKALYKAKAGGRNQVVSLAE
jgi:diguanylate cyclase (GGDEF)-like protein